MQWQHSRKLFWTLAAALLSACWVLGADAANECRRQFTVDATKPDATLGNVAKMVNVWNARACGLSTATNRQDYDIFEFVEWIELMQCTGGNAQRDLFRDPSDRSTKDDYDFAPIIDVIRGVRRLGAKPYLKLGNVPQKFTDGFDSGEFAINTRPPDDWDAHYRYMRAFASALVRAFGRDEVRSWRFALLTEADNRGWFRAKSGSDEDSFAAYCRLYLETYRAFAEVLGTGFAYGTHVLGEGYEWKRWTADQFCSFCAREKLPLDIIALSFYDTVGKSPRARRLSDQVIGTWRTAAAAHGFKKAIWGYDEGRIIVGAKGRDKNDIGPRAVGDTYQAAYDARLTKNLFDLGVDYFSNWDYFAGENPVLDGIPAVTFHVAREVAKFKGMRRVPFALSAAEGADELEESDGVAAVSADGSLLRMMVYNFRNQLSYVRLAEASVTVKTAFPAGTRVRIVRRTVDDAVNWFDDWERDRQAKGIRNEDYSWSPDGYCLLSRTGLIKSEHRDFFKAQLPRYAEMVKLVPEAEDATVAADCTVRLSARLSGNAVAFFEVRRYPSESKPVNVDVGRQLFVDDALVEMTTLRRMWHHPVKFEGNPVMKPETPWEVNVGGNDTVRPNGGGMWWDEQEKVFKLWYEGGWLHTVCYATSKDGINWERPTLDVVKGTNIVLPTNNPAFRPDSWTVVMDPCGKDPAERYKLALHRPWADAPNVPDGICATSADGKSWKVLYPLPPCGDRSSMFYDPFREKWVFSLRTNWDAGRRCRSIFETDDFMVAPEWYVDPKGYAVDQWLAASTNDLVTAKESDFTRCQLYNFDAIAYESVMLGLFEIHQGPENNVCEKAGRPKITEVKFGFSRDGRNFVRGDYTAAIPSEGWDSGKWDAGYVQPLANGCVIKGDELWFYYGAFSGEPTRGNTKEKRYAWTVDNGMYAHAAMGLAKLRRDGFASFDGTGELLTKPLAASGHHLFVNAAAKSGSLAVELVGADGKVLPGYAAEDSQIENFDSTKCRVVWKTKSEIDLPASLHYRLRFTLKDAALYSFWLSRAPTGESNGWLAGGGPGYAGLRDVPPPRPEIAPHLLAPDAEHALSTRRHEGIPSIAVSPKGRMWATWYAGPTPWEDEGNYLVLTSSTDGGKTWQEQKILDPDGKGLRRAFDPELWISPDGKLRWTWTDRVGTVRSTSEDDQLWMATLDPETGAVLEQPRRIASGVMMNKPIVLKDGTWIFPVASWWVRESSGCWASTDGGRTFVKRGGVTVPRELRGFDEHTILEKRDGTLKCYIRTFNGKGNCLWEAESKDAGYTWSAPRPTKAAHLSSRVFVTKLHDGRWLMVKAGGFGRIWDKRRDLVALVSDDEGETWWGGLRLDNRAECSYPDGVQLPDGSLVVVSDYSRTKEREISFVRFSPDDVIGGCAKVERRIISSAKKGAKE